MKIYHVQFETDDAAKQAVPSVDRLDGVLEASTHRAFGNGPAYVVVVTQDSFDPAVFQREYSLMYESKPAKQQTEYVRGEGVQLVDAAAYEPASEVEVAELPNPEPVED